MIKKWLITGISLIAVVLLTITSLSNVIGYQTVQSSNQSAIKERINQRELLFQTIVDIANNKEIQRIILKSQISRGIFPTSEIPVVTKTQIRQMYFIGLILSKVISKSRIQSMIGKYQFSNQEMQKEISVIIEKNPTLKTEISQLQNSKCDCENDGYYPKICDFLTNLMNIFFDIFMRSPFYPSFLIFIITFPFVFIVAILYCFVFNCVN
jgi:hypothetical protein